KYIIKIVGGIDMADFTLEIEDLHVSIEGNEILKGVTLTIKSGELHAVMRPNGTGKSTLAYSVMDHSYKVNTQGNISVIVVNVIISIYGDGTSVFNMYTR